MLSYIKKLDKNIIFFCIIIFAILLYNSSHERIWLNNGNGPDGDTYVQIMKSMPDALTNNTLPSYYYQRLFPLGLCHYSLDLFNLPPTNINVQNFFIVIYFAIILASIFVFSKISDLLNFSKNTWALAFILMFYNFAILKFLVYYPILTDAFAFFEGLLILYFYLKKSFLPLLIVSIFSLFTIPTVIFLSSILLIAFDKDSDAEVKEQPQFKFILYYLLPAMVAIIPVAFTAHAYLFNYAEFDWPRVTNKGTLSWVDTPQRIMLILSVTTLTAMIFITYRRLLRYLPDILSSVKNIRYVKIAIMVFVFILCQMIVKACSDPNAANPMTFVHYIYMISYHSLVYPLVTIVSHSAFLGLSFILIIFFHKTIFNNAHLLGKGFILFLFFNMLLMMGTESRQYMYVLPFIVILIANGLKDKTFDNRLILVMAIVGLITSSFWFNINVPGIENLETNRMLYPKQRYYEFSGPWMSRLAYYKRFAIFTASTIIVWLMFRKHLSSGRIKKP